MTGTSAGERYVTRAVEARCPGSRANDRCGATCGSSRIPAAQRVGGEEKARSGAARSAGFDRRALAEGVCVDGQGPRSVAAACPTEAHRATMASTLATNRTSRGRGEPRRSRRRPRGALPASCDPGARRGPALTNRGAGGEGDIQDARSARARRSRSPGRCGAHPAPTPTLLRTNATRIELRGPGPSPRGSRTACMTATMTKHEQALPRPGPSGSGRRRAPPAGRAWAMSPLAGRPAEKRPDDDRRRDDLPRPLRSISPPKWAGHHLLEVWRAPGLPPLASSSVGLSRAQMARRAHVEAAPMSGLQERAEVRPWANVLDNRNQRFLFCGPAGPSANPPGGQRRGAAPRAVAGWGSCGAKPVREVCDAPADGA